MLLNGAATGIVKLADRESLWDSALRSLAGATGEPPRVELADGQPLEMRFEPVLDGTRLVGVLIRPRATPRSAASAVLDGWSSLTGTELAVAEQVAKGMTNREAAAHLYLSPHTIDYHLRQVFRKLEIRSRVDLTRIIAQR
jgi:DNA-binding CsgD family transcriptional regulator